VVVVSDGLWRRDFGADPDIVGKTIDVNNRPLTVVGVADAAFHGTTAVYDVELYLPVMMAPDLGFAFGSRETSPAAILADPGGLFCYAHGRLRPGVTLASAAAQTEALGAQLMHERPLEQAAERWRAVSFWRTPGGGPSQLVPTLTVLAAMGLLV